jgi:hypothetical protein
MLAVLSQNFEKLTPGTRIVSFHFPIPNWEPIQTEVVDHPLHAPPAVTNTYLYIVGQTAKSS